MTKKRKTKKQKIKANKRKTEMINELNVLKEKKNSLQSELVIQKKKDRKHWHIRNFRLFSNVCNLISPYVITAGITSAIIATSGGGFPIYRDNIVKTNTRHIEYSNSKELEIEDYYRTYNWVDDALPDSELIITTPWVFDENSYKRIRREYEVPKELDEELFKMIINKEYEELADKLPYKEEIEYKNELVDKTNNETEATVVIYTKLKDDKLIYPEADSRNQTITVVEALIVGVIATIAARYRDFNYHEEVIRIKTNYKYEIRNTTLLVEEIDETNEKIKLLTSRIGGVGV